MELTRNLKIDFTEEHSADIFTELHKERRDWNISTVPKESFMLDLEGLEECFQRATAIGLDMELPVGSFVRNILEKISDIPQTAIPGLIANIKDEEKHERAFKAIAKIYHPSLEHAQYSGKVRSTLVKWQISPLQKARDLETIVFIPLQSFLRFFGGEAMERLIADISHDEFRHVNYGWELSSVLNIGLCEEEFEDYLKQIASWCFEPLTRDHTYGRDFWVNTITDMARDGQSEALTRLFNYGVHKAPFEINNANY